MATLKIIAGTVYGNAQHVAEQVEENKWHKARLEG